MINRLSIILAILSLGGFLPTQGYAQQDVHFGTIFVEDIQYETSDDSQQINHLTDQSSKQNQLETLYKTEIGEPNAKLKKFNASDRVPASNTSAKDDEVEKQVGVVRNSDLPKQIIYFIELRSFEGNNPISIRQSASPSSKKVIDLQPGEMVKIVDTPSQYIHKMRMDRDNQGLWKPVHTREQDIQKPNLYYDWRNFTTITSHDFPIELDIMVPYGRNSTPTFSKPGAWSWKDCGLSESLCVDQIDIHTKAYLFDATIVDVSSSANGSQHELFYKIGYQLKDKDGKLQHHVGWIQSRHAKRKITQLPKSLLATRSPDSFGTYESDNERMQRLKKYYVFDSNMDSKNRTINRWLSSTPGKTTEVFLQNIAFDGMVNFSNFELSQDFQLATEGEPFSQQGVSIGAGIFAPIFIDLEIQGMATIMVPIEANETDIYKKTPIFRGEQWLLYTTPVSINGAPFKFGFGAYYMSMFSAQRDFGFNSLVGFQAKGLFETKSFWTGFRYGPTGQDFNFRFENREVGFEFGYRLDPARHYESWTIFADFSDTNFNSATIDNSTKYQLLSIGLRKQF